MHEGKESRAKMDEEESRTEKDEEGGRADAT
jgi:hypothetical protein